MNPDAIRHYIRWLSRKWSPWPLYGSIVVTFASATFLLGGLGHVSPAPSVARQVGALLIAGGGGVLFAAAIYFGARLGGWTLFTRLEAGTDYRQVWYELMTKYRGLGPDIIDSIRFRRMLSRLCDDIVRHEELTDEQQKWISELKTLAAEPPKSTGRSATAEIASKHGGRIFAVVMAVVVIVSLLRLLSLW